MRFLPCHRTLQLWSRVTAVTLLPALVVACTEDQRVSDDTPLSSLSSSELGELCDELRAGWPKPGEQLTCKDGSTLSLSGSSSDACTEVPASTCSLSTGAVRACNDALLADPCAAFTQPPEACAAIAAAGCGASVFTPPVNGACRTLQARDVEALEGVYQRVWHTENDASCDAEGPSRLSSDEEQLFVVVGVESFGAPVAAVESCRDLAACRARAAQLREQSQSPALQPLEPSSRVAPELQQVIQCRGESPGSLRAGGFSVGSDAQGGCHLSEENITVTRSADGSLRFEGRIAAWTKPRVDEGCGYTAGERPSDAPCVELEVQEGRFLSAF